MDVLKGIPVSSGVVIGSAFVLDDVRRRIPRRVVPPARVPREHERLDNAIEASIAELRTLYETAERELGGEPAKIFAFHLGVLQDETLTDPMHARIESEQVTAEHAVSMEFQRVAGMFSSMTDSAFSTKMDDIWDLDRRVLRHLVGEHLSELAEVREDAIVISREMTPSQTAGLPRDKVIGFATDAGGRTSHTAIVARALGIPAVVGLEELTSRVADGDRVIVDGDRGVVILNPDEQTLEDHRRR
jgi:phosphotransferase system enzyme I (PtsI)